MRTGSRYCHLYIARMIIIIIMSIATRVPTIPDTVLAQRAPSTRIENSFLASRSSRDPAFDIVVSRIVGGVASPFVRVWPTLASYLCRLLDFSAHLVFFFAPSPPRYSHRHRSRTLFHSPSLALSPPPFLLTRNIFVSLRTELGERRQGGGVGRGWMKVVGGRRRKSCTLN